MSDHIPRGEIIELPEDLAAYSAGGSGYPSRVKEPIAAEATRLLAVARKLGRRLSYAMGRSQLGPAERGALPDQDTIKTFTEYTKAVLGLMKEQRERLDLVLKYKLQPDFTEDQLRGKLRAIVEESLDAMADDELEAALERRRIARAKQEGDSGQ